MDKYNYAGIRLSVSRRTNFIFHMSGFAVKQRLEQPFWRALQLMKFKWATWFFLVSIKVSAFKWSPLLAITIGSARVLRLHQFDDIHLQLSIHKSKISTCSALAFDYSIYHFKIHNFVYRIFKLPPVRWQTKMRFDEFQSQMNFNDRRGGKAVSNAVIDVQKKIISVRK